MAVKSVPTILIEEINKEVEKMIKDKKYPFVECDGDFNDFLNYDNRFLRET